MSIGTKQPLAVAKANAEAFRQLFRERPTENQPFATYARWTFAGSIRRGKAEVSDIEHVICPAYGNVGAGLYADTNLLWHRVDELVADGTIAKHVRANGTTCWGAKHRVIDFRGFKHDVYLADAHNWGNILAIRTGPAEFSQYLVTIMRAMGFRQRDGYLWRGAERISVPDEETFFRCCGIALTPPEMRGVEVVAR